MKSNNIGQLSLVVTAVSFIGLTTSLPATAATLYNVLDLGVIRESGSTSATGINDLGQVIGISFFPEGARESFRTAPNSPINPATDLIVSLASGTESTPNGINNSGQVVGTRIPSASRFTSAYITQPNGSTGVDTLFIGDANDINDSGQFTGRALVTDPTTGSIYHAVLENSNDSNGFIDLGTLGGTNSSGNGINNLGQVVGDSETANGQVRAFRTAANSAINSATDDLGTLGGSSSSANDINDNGQVVGVSETASGETRAFLTAANSVINSNTDNLGTLGGSFSIAYGINELGQVVGDSELADGSDRAFLFADNTLFDINDLIPETSDFVLTSARGINEQGQIAATAFFSNSQTTRAVLLTPVPEPTSMLGVLAFGAGAGILRKKVKRK